MTQPAKPHCDHANWRNHRPEDDIEVSGTDHKPDCSVYYNDPKHKNCDCGLWEAAKPVSDAAEIVREFAEAVRISVSEGVDYARKSDMLWVTTTGDYGMSTHGFKIRDIEKAADTIERLQKIEQRAKAMEERLKFDSSDRACIVDHILTGAIWSDGVRCEGDQLQGGSDK